MALHRLDTVDSTNRYCELLDLTKVEEFACYYAHTQTAGIGQRDHCWHSAPGENLTFSLITHPTFLSAADQFRLTMALSLGIYRWLWAIIPYDIKQRYAEQRAQNPKFKIPSPQITIKWPNDIYVDDCKICGILTTVRVQGSHLAHAITGIGLNLNQTLFPSWVPNPTSLRLITGREYPLEDTLRALIDTIDLQYGALRFGVDPLEDYQQALYRRGVPSPFLLDGKPLTATIQGVNRYGHLQLITAEGEHLSCQMHQLQHVLPCDQ